LAGVETRGKLAASIVVGAFVKDKLGVGAFAEGTFVSGAIAAAQVIADKPAVLDKLAVETWSIRLAVTFRRVAP